MISNNHPIKPPPSDLQKEWQQEWLMLRPSLTTYGQWMSTKGTRWGADQQLAICVKWLEDHGYDLAAPDLQDHCRPSKPQPPQTVVIDGHTYRLEE